MWSPADGCQQTQLAGDGVMDGIRETGVMDGETVVMDGKSGVMDGIRETVVMDGKKVVMDGETGVMDGIRETVVMDGVKETVVMDGVRETVVMDGVKETVVMDGVRETVVMDGIKETVVMDGVKETVVMDGETVVMDGETGTSNTAPCINHLLLSTHITALNVKNNYVFIGEGQHFHVHDIGSGERLSSIEVLRAAVIHGIRLETCSLDNENVWMVAIFGQKSLTVVRFTPSQSKCCIFMEERVLEDWIVDAAWETDFSHIVLALAHNSLLRYEVKESSKTVICATNELDSREENIDYSYMSVLNCGQISGNDECIPNCNMHNAIQQQLNKSRKRDLSILATAECTERCVVFCGRVVVMSGSGSLFSVNFCPVQNIITTTSDDRSLIIWDVVNVKHQSSKNIRQASCHVSPEQVKLYWKESQIVEKVKCYGHSARVWRSLILSSCIVSVGEDSQVCVWDNKGTLIMKWRAHDGASIWSIAATQCEDKVITGGGDGGVKSWSLNVNALPCAAPLSNLPWFTDILCEVKNRKTLFMQMFSEDPRQLGVDVLNNDENIVKENHSQLFIKNGLSKDCDVKAVKTHSKEKSANQDFPRCVSLLGMNKYLVMMDSGNLYLWDQNSSSWSLCHKDQRLMNYVVMETCPSQKLVALGTLSGDVIILALDTGNFEVLLDVKTCEGKVFSLLWLAQNCILVCGAAGIITVWEVHANTGEMNKKWSHDLPCCKQRWVSAACVYPPTPRNATQNLICGDRAGSLHLYSPGVTEAQHTLRGIHGRNGVTSLSLHGNLIYSTGRDGCVRCLAVEDRHLQIIRVSRVCNVNWVAKLVLIFGRPLAVCFHDVKLIVWSLEEDRTVVEVECGGGHRSWDLQVSETENRLICLFLKDGRPYTFQTTLKDKLLPLIKSPVNTHETMCLQILFQRGLETVFATGGEDTTLRLHSILGFEKRKTLGVIRSHISNIRAMCVIEGRERVTTVQEEDQPVWLVSAGGRAQVKVWRASYGKPEVSSDIKKEVQVGYNIDQVSLWLSTTSVICQEVASHMLRTGSHKTWKSQELTFDPETRYMDATAFWITKTRALLALASSDGVLRIFQFNTETERLEMLCCEELDHCLLKVTRLQVPDTTIVVSTTTGGRVLFFDLQSAAKWILDSDGSPSLPAQHSQQLGCIAAHQSGVNGLCFNYHNSMRIADAVHTITMATGGDDNKLSVWEVLVDVSRAEKIKISIRNICSVFGHSAQITDLHWISSELLVSTSIDQRLIMWKLTCGQKNESHMENISETEKINQTYSCKTRILNSIDETKTWSDCKQWSSASLKAVCVHFTGVPDVKGHTLVDVNDTRRQDKAKIIKRIFVYGMGLQIYELCIGDDDVP
nr:WD repeat-containing protein 6-like [Procambarus clarkii]